MCGHIGDSAEGGVPGARCEVQYAVDQFAVVHSDQFCPFQQGPWTRSHIQLGHRSRVPGVASDRNLHLGRHAPGAMVVDPGLELVQCRQTGCSRGPRHLLAAHRESLAQPIGAFAPFGLRDRDQFTNRLVRVAGQRGDPAICGGRIAHPQLFRLPPLVVLGWLGCPEELLGLVGERRVVTCGVPGQQHRLERVCPQSEFGNSRGPDGHPVASHRHHGVRFTVIPIVGLRHQDDRAVLAPAAQTRESGHVQRHRRHGHLPGFGQAVHGCTVQECLESTGT